MGDGFAWLRSWLKRRPQCSCSMEVSCIIREQVRKEDTPCRLTMRRW